MAAVICMRFPHKAPKLLAYQATIIKVGRNYEGTQWVSYDRRYHQEALGHKDLNWSMPDPRLYIYNEAFTGRTRAIPRCSYCLDDDYNVWKILTTPFWVIFQAWAPGQCLLSPNLWQSPSLTRLVAALMKVDVTSSNAANISIFALLRKSAPNPPMCPEATPRPQEPGHISGPSCSPLLTKTLITIQIPLMIKLCQLSWSNMLYYITCPFIIIPHPWVRRPIKGHHKISHSSPQPYKLVIAIQLHNWLTMPWILQIIPPTFMPSSVFDFHSTQPRCRGDSIIFPSWSGFCPIHLQWPMLRLQDRFLIWLFSQIKVSTDGPICTASSACPLLSLLYIVHPLEPPYRC